MCVYIYNYKDFWNNNINTNYNLNIRRLACCVQITLKMFLNFLEIWGGLRPSWCNHRYIYAYLHVSVKNARLQWSRLFCRHNASWLLSYYIFRQVCFMTQTITWKNVPKIIPSIWRLQLRDNPSIFFNVIYSISKEKSKYWDLILPYWVNAYKIQM